MVDREGNDADASGQNAGESDRARASEPLEEVGRRLGRFFASAAARVREEAEDILAEAQSIRRGERD